MRLRAAILGRFDRLTQNVLCVSRTAATQADPQIILDGHPFDLFRAGRTLVYIHGTPASLNKEDIMAINGAADNGELEANKKVKRIVSSALSRYFNNRAVTVTEAGCGNYPILPYLRSQNMQADYRAVECDPGIIDNLTARKVPVSDWSDIMSVNAPKTSKNPALMVSIYALHFMVNAKLPKRVSHLTNEDGFFVGNFFCNPKEKNCGEQREKLAELLTSRGMAYLTIPDPDLQSNEYWIISRAGDVSHVHDFAKVLESSVLIHRDNRRPLAVPAP